MSSALQTTLASGQIIQFSAQEKRALDLLVDGVPQTQVAAALGVTDSVISQYISREEFKTALIERKVSALLEHTTRDRKYDSLEDQLLDKLKETLPMLYKPMEITRVLTLINAAKRRGSTSEERITERKAVINLTLPVQIVQQFQVNSNNQVIKAGNQDLITVQSGRMTELIKSGAKSETSNAPRVERIEAPRAA